MTEHGSTASSSTRSEERTSSETQKAITEALDVMLYAYHCTGRLKKQLDSLKRQRERMDRELYQICRASAECIVQLDRVKELAGIKSPDQDQV